jgi:hypothetical protein
MACYGRVDLDDALVRGGTMYGDEVAANWWAMRRRKFNVRASDVTRERFSLVGDTEEVPARIQHVISARGTPTCAVAPMPT